jgi:hypothetical protein
LGGAGFVPKLGVDGGLIGGGGGVGVMTGAGGAAGADTGAGFFAIAGCGALGLGRETAFFREAAFAGFAFFLAGAAALFAAGFFLATFFRFTLFLAAFFLPAFFAPFFLAIVVLSGFSGIGHRRRETRTHRYREMWSK